MSNKSCSDYVNGYDAGYSSTCGKNPDGCNNILSAISPDPFLCSSKDHINIRAYENSVEIFSDHPQRKYQVINIPQVADIKTIRATYKNGILEIVFKKKEKLKLNNIKIE